MIWTDIAVAALAVICALLVRRFVFMFVRVKGVSMLDTLRNGDMLLCVRLPWVLKKLRRGDVVLCHYPGEGKKLLVKRLVALPGDELAFHSGELYIDGQPAAEPYVTRRAFGERPEIRLGPEEYYVLGDNRPVSRDSRRVGPVRRDMIIGRAPLRFRLPFSFKRL